MEIRAVTLFAEPNFDTVIATGFFEAARSAFHVPVQTNRLATTPFPTWWDPYHFTTLQVRDLVEPWQEAGADFLSFGPILMRHDAGWMDRVPDLIASNETIFLSAEIADAAGYVDIGRCSAVAEIIQRLSTLKSDGSANLQFAALANCSPGTPFFPVAYHNGGPAHFAIAVEAADMALAIFQEAGTAEDDGSLAQAQNKLITAVEKEASALAEVANELAKEHQISFSGIDFTLAPFPAPERSLAAALESLGLSRLGSPGSLFAAAFAADAVGRAKFPRCGFSGLMFPVLEDTVIAIWAGDGLISLSDLLGYAAVCGAGLDVVPLPGSAPQHTLAGVLLDVAGMAVRLDKPLTARLMPLPGLEAGDPIGIEFPWFAKGRVMPLAKGGIRGMLGQPTRVQLRSYQASRKG